MKEFGRNVHGSISIIHFGLLNDDKYIIIPCLRRKINWQTTDKHVKTKLTRYD